METVFVAGNSIKMSIINQMNPAKHPIEIRQVAQNEILSLCFQPNSVFNFK